MTTLTVPDRYLALAPVIVSSPTSRCGTTLVQRLLTASGNGFIYGEEVGHQIRTVTVWLIGLLRRFEQTGPSGDEDFARALAGTLADWRPGITAPAEIMRSAWIETYYQLPAALADYSRSVGRPVWGFKLPGLDRDTLKALLSLMPRTRVVYLIRNLADVLSSAKARRFVATQEETARFCAEWATNVRESIDLAFEKRVLVIRYEDLLAEREDHLRLLEQFTGAQGLDPRVFDLKLNTFEGQAEDGCSPSQYIAPAELTKVERDIVMGEAGPVLTYLYPQPFGLADAA